MGSPESDQYAMAQEFPQRRIRLTRGFWIGCTPVTCEQWEVCMDRIPRTISQKGYPVAMMMWTTAQDFTIKLTALLQEMGILEAGQSFSLPSEAQWEYACRAGTTSSWYFGDDIALLEQHAFYRDNNGFKTAPVGQKLPNPWGLHDLYGNVYEWCLDNRYGYMQQLDNTTDPVIQYDSALRVLKALRGGSWNSMADQCRSAYRNHSDVRNIMDDPTGVRLVLKDN